jgi:alkyl hydroperoxide reductase subunit AhpF
MEKVLDQSIVKQIQQAFEGMKEPVQVLLFTSKNNCDYCSETQQLLEEVTALNDNLQFTVHDIDEDPEMAGRYNVTNAPGIVIAAKDEQDVKNLGIQFSGIPSGHEFNTLINDILMVSRRDSGLDGKTREFLKTVINAGSGMVVGAVPEQNLLAEIMRALQN